MDNITLKKCSKCGIEKEFNTDNFRIKDSKRGTYKSQCRPCEYKRNVIGKFPFVCTNCGKEYLAKTKDRNKFCSRECSFVYKSNHKKEKPTKPEKIKPIKPEIKYVFKDCKHCSKPFRVKETNNLKLYCSTRCTHKAMKNNRKYRERGQYVAPVYRADIYKRDDYTCQLCGRKADMTKSVPHPMSPTLDHVIPLARGGTHEPSNVQLAHFICNATKSDRLLV